MQIKLVVVVVVVVVVMFLVQGNSFHHENQEYNNRLGPHPLQQAEHLRLEID